MKQNEALSSENIELTWDEPTIMKTHLNEIINLKMENSSMKSKGHVKKEDLELFLWPKRNSKSENGIISKFQESAGDMSRVKEEITHSTPEGFKSKWRKQRYEGSSTSKAKSYDESHKLWKISESHHPSKLTVEISMMLKKLSEMHSHENYIPNQNIINDFLPADECNQTIRDIEVADQNLFVTMKDVNPAE